MNHTKVAQAFANKKKATGSRMFTNGKTIYSYGYHFPIAHWINSNIVLFNIDGYSSSTSTHKRYVESAISNHSIIECTTNEIKEAVNREKFKIEKKTDYSVDDLFDKLKDEYKIKGMKRFPMKKMRKFLDEELLFERL